MHFCWADQADKVVMVIPSLVVEVGMTNAVVWMARMTNEATPYQEAPAAVGFVVWTVVLL